LREKKRSQEKWSSGTKEVFGGTHQTGQSAGKRRGGKKRRPIRRLKRKGRIQQQQLRIRKRRGARFAIIELGKKKKKGRGVLLAVCGEIIGV